MGFGLNQEVRHVIDVTGLTTGVGVTGLTTGSFTITLRRKSGATLVTDTATVTVTEIDAGTLPGKYWVTYTPATAAGLHRLTIRGTDSENVVNPQVHEDDIAGGAALSTGPYLTTRANFKTAFNITDTKHDGRIDALLAQITTWVQSYTGSKILSATYTELKDGRNAQRLALRTGPVTSITTVHESTDEPRVYGAGQLLVQDTDYLLEGDGTTAILHRLGGARWPLGPNTVQAVYVGGYASVPEDLERAAQEIMAIKLYKAAGKLYHVGAENRGDGKLVVDPMRNDIPHRTLEVIDLYADHMRAA